MNLIDNHLHLGTQARIEEVEQYASLFSLKALALISLPDPIQGNFNDPLLAFKKKHPTTTYIFGEFDYRTGSPPLTQQLKSLYQKGFDGLKLILGKPAFSHAYGISLREKRFAEVFQLAGEGFSKPFPILVHVGDPYYFWVENKTKEHGPFEAWIELAEELVDRFTHTVFIFPHLLFLAHDLGRLQKLILARKGVYTDLAPGNYFYHELGQRRKEAIEFFSCCRDRILFGSDGFFFEPTYKELPFTDLKGNLERTCRLVQFLETTLPFPNPFPLSFDQAPLVRGIGLREEPEGADILEQVYYKNFYTLMGTSPRSL